VAVNSTRKGGGARPRRLRLGDRDAIAHGLPTPFWGDLHHHAVTARWSSFFVVAALVFVLFNLAFATLYLLGDDPVANARPGRFLDYFFFSIETFATVGYGDMHPRTAYGHAVAAVGAFVGVCALAVTTGLIFARFTRPRARVLFANAAVVAPFNGAPTLMIRFANARHNVIVDASAKLWLVRSETSAEGVFYRRFLRLPLTRDESPMFALSWTIMHVLDESSPLAGSSAADFAASDESLIVMFEGHDETASQTLRARRNYPLADVLYGQEYDDVITLDADGRVTIDYGRFHDAHAARTAG
jgi:inward rectifier potassium channel